MSTPLPKFRPSSTPTHAFGLPPLPKLDPLPKPTKAPRATKAPSPARIFLSQRYQGGKGQLELATYWQGSIQRVEAFHRGEVSLGQMKDSSLSMIIDWKAPLSASPKPLRAGNCNSPFGPKRA